MARRAGARRLSGRQWAGQAVDALFLIPLDGGPAERLSPDPSLHPAQGYANAWPCGEGVLLQWAGYGLCGGQYLIRHDGTIEELHWDLPNPAGADHMIDVGPDRIVILNGGATGPGNTGALVAVTPSTGEVRVFIPGNPAEGGVLWALTPESHVGARAGPCPAVRYIVGRVP